MNIFTLNSNGFDLITNIPPNASINKMTEHLGYHPSTLFTFWHNYKENNDIQFIALEIFSKNIIYVATKNDIRTLSLSKVNFFLNKLDDDDIYESYGVQDKLRTGIEHKTLSKEFLSKILELNDIDDIWGGRVPVDTKLR